MESVGAEEQTEGVSEQAEKVAALLGESLLPWQREVLDAAFEVDPTTGDYRYQRFELRPTRGGVMAFRSALREIEPEF